MAVAPVPFVTATSATSSATYTETVSVTTPQGAALVVVCGSSGSDSSTGVADSQGNTYTQVATSTINENVQCYVALACTALTGGTDTITATWTSATTQQKNIIGVYVQGGYRVDLAASNNGSTSALSVTGGTPAYQNELCFAVVQAGSGGYPYTGPSVTGGQPYTLCVSQVPSGQQSTAIWYQWLAKPFAQSLATTLAASVQWACLVVSLSVNQLTSPSVPDFLAGYGPQQSDMQSLWVNPLLFFQGRVVFRAVQAVNSTTLPSSGAVTKIAYDDVLEDPYGGWSASTHEWTPPSGCSGWYQVTVTVYVAAPSAQNIVLSPYIGGNEAYNWVYDTALSKIVIPETVAGAEGTFFVYLTGGQDAIWGAGAIVNASSNLTTNLATGEQSSIEVIWLGS